ncbi:MAG TPA: hypothetical protein VG474_04905, partial [Solirubrobacteraceae bacterium]|nr:hypothetical protein [Solirubrobacteraceae bacterium]
MPAAAATATRRGRRGRRARLGCDRELEQARAQRLALADLATGEREPLRARLERLFDELAPVAARLGCDRELEQARALASGPG